MINTELLTKEFLHECFKYVEGDLYWNMRPLHHFKDTRAMKIWNTKYSNTLASKYDKSSNTVTVTIYNKRYTAYKIIWKMFYDEDIGCVQHLDSNSMNNKIDNLAKLNEFQKPTKNTVLDNFEVNELPTQDFLLECFNCDFEVGVLYWKERPMYHFANERVMRMWNTKFSGKRAGNISCGYVEVSIDNISRRVHRLIWKMYYGTEPGHILDHINGDKSDNRIFNLREVSHAENTLNLIEPNRVNTSGYTGVKYFVDRDRYYASINFENKSISLGYHHTVEEGALARELKFKELYGEEFYNSCGRDTLLQELITKVEEILNTRNMNVTSKRNTSGYTGVVYDKKRDEYRSRIGYDKKLITLGTFKTAEEAALVYQLKYIELYGEEKYLKLLGSKTLLEELKAKVEEIKNNRI